MQQCSFTTRHVLNSDAADEKREQVQRANVFKRQTLTFNFATYRPNSFKHLWHHTPVRPYERIDCCDRCIGRWNKMATRSFLIYNTFSTMSKLLHQACIASLIKHLSPYSGRIWDWTASPLILFRQPKTNNNAVPYGRLSAPMHAPLSNVYKINDVIVTSP